MSASRRPYHPYQQYRPPASSTLRIPPTHRQPTSSTKKRIYIDLTEDDDTPTQPPTAKRQRVSGEGLDQGIGGRIIDLTGDDNDDSEQDDDDDEDEGEDSEDDGDSELELERLIMSSLASTYGSSSRLVQSMDTLLATYLDGYRQDDIPRVRNSVQQIQNPIEQRRAKWISRPSHQYYDRLDRAREQSFFIINRTRQGTDAFPEELVELAGETGNLYKVHIKSIPSCTCPDWCGASRGYHCKHVIYVLLKVLKASTDLRCQVAFLSSELKPLFSGSPIPRSVTSTTVQRKSLDNDCPICMEPFDSEEDRIIWCKTGCGGNVHETCFKTWTRAQNKPNPSCVYCRALWQREDHTARSVNRAMARGRVNEEGYVSVGGILGLNPHRETDWYY